VTNRFDAREEGDTRRRIPPLPSPLAATAAYCVAFAVAALFGLAGCGGGVKTETSTPDLASAVHPPATKPRASGALGLCPSETGLEHFTTSGVQAAAKIAALYGDIGRADDLAMSDRAWWPRVKELWANGHSPLGRFAVVSDRPLASDRALSAMVKHSCGASLVRFTEVLAVRPTNPTRHCNACGTEMFFIERVHRPLIYFIR